MAIVSLMWNKIVGGWKTWGPGRIVGNGAFAGADDGTPAINEETALKLAAVWACTHLRAETIGSLPIHIRNRNKEVLTDHPLHRLLHWSPNAYMTASEYFSLCNAHVDMHGNSVSVIDRDVKGYPVSLMPYHPDVCEFKFNKSGTRKTWIIDGDEYPDDNVLQLRGFSLDGAWGASRLESGRSIIGAQLAANNSALRAFKQGIKVGGFLIPERKLDGEQKKLIESMLDKHAKPENIAKWMTLIPGMKPIAGTEFSVKPADAQLLESRLFGSVEVCMLYGVPPPLVGITDKASSWASSLENLNLFFTTYSVYPTVRRSEQSFWKKLLTPADRGAGIEAKFTMQALLRGDMQARREYYASALQNGWLNRNEVRDLEERGKIDGGDEYTIQTNMTGVANNTTPEGAKK